MSSPHPIVVFDGECALCNGFVAWLIRHDSLGRFLIAGSAGDVGAAVVAAAGLDSQIAASTLIVWDGTVHVRSRAIIAIARGLPWPWRAIAAIRLVPTFARDGVYRFIAARRPRMRADDPACGVPPEDLVALWRSRLATMADVRV